MIIGNESLKGLFLEFDEDVKENGIDLMNEVVQMNNKRYKCPRCKSTLVYHHEDKETVTFECKNCNHFVLARKW